MSNGDIADLLFIDEDELDNDNSLKALEEKYEFNEYY